MEKPAQRVEESKAGSTEQLHQRVRESHAAVKAMVDKLSVSDLDNRAEVLTLLEGVLFDYKQTGLQLAETVDAEHSAAPNYETNLAFWHVVNEEIFSNVLEKKTAREIAEMYKGIDAADLAFNLTYNTIIFHSAKRGKYIELQKKLLENAGPEQQKALFDKLIQTFLTEDPVVFYSHYEQFVERLLTANFQLESSEYFLNKLVKTIGKFDENRDGDWRQLLLFALIFGRRLEAGKAGDSRDRTAADDTNDLLPNVIRVVVFILEKDLLAINPKFKGILVRMVDDLANKIFVSQNSTHLQELLSTTIKQLKRARLLNMLDAPLEEQEKKALGALQSSNAAPPKQLGALDDFYKVLIRIAQDELAQPLTEESSRLLVFCLKHILQTVEILNQTVKKDEASKAASTAVTVPLEFQQQIIAFLREKGEKNERLLQLAIQLIVDEHLSMETLNLIAEILFSVQPEHQFSIVDSLVQNLGEVFTKRAGPKEKG